MGISICVYFLVFVLLFSLQLGETPLVYRTSDAYHWFGGDTYQRFNEFEKNKKFEVIILGSSHAYHGYDSRIFKASALNAFNLGTSGQSIFNTELIAKNLLNHSNCKLVVLDIYPGTFQTDGFESTSDLIANISSHSAAIEIAKGQKDIRVINMLALRFLSHKFSNPIYQDENYVNGGYVIRRDSVKKDFDFESYLSEYELTSKNLNALKNLLLYFNEQNIKCIVVNHPMPLKISPEKFELFDREIQAVVKLTGHEFKNFASGHDLDTKNHFYDHHHLNHAGVSIYNEQLIAYLKQNSYLN